MFKVGDVVQWRSGAHGYMKDKVGTVVKVLQPGDRPNRILYPSLWKGIGPGYGRRTPSYVVRVGKRHYWPVVSLLHAVSSPQQAEYATCQA